ncbi:tripartite motif-containing protein 2 [Patella vulgata]|uniref:tripartite motif-containing protein 2 n=1 Tax=Patella vulgata TaxID=6465 RepID=UPI0024A7CA54|nr:tripartite motif-containing protein 2 [Patella vulgata]XP_050406555.2 tripartite motif-containing protein 2 [Patella vulgata]XP_055956964.1 tripartite motif-containing protein 2 [Patella vulgata]
MAASGDGIPTISKLKEKVLENFLSCIICTETLVNPHQLQCQHTFCLTCLENYVEKSKFVNKFPCPICRTPITITSGKLDTQSNLLIKNILVFFSNIKEEIVQSNSFPGSVSKFCQLCEEERDSRSYCLQCSNWLCEPCTRGHKKIPNTKTHELLPLQEYNEVVCGLLSEKCSKIEEFAKSIEGCLISLQSAKGKTIDNLSKLQIEVNNQCEMLKGAIENCRQKLLKELDGKTGEILEQIHSISSPLKNIQEQLDHISSTYKNVSPTHLDHNQLDQMENASLLLIDEYGQIKDRVVNVLSVPSLEYKQDLAHIENARGIPLGQIFLRQSVTEISAPNQVGVIRLMQRSSSSNHVTSVAVFDDKNYIAASSSELLHFMDGNESKIKIQQGFSNYTVFGVAKSKQKPKLIFVTVMELCLGTGKVCVYKENYMQFKLSETIVTNLTCPRGIAVGSQGTVFVCDQHDRCIYMFTDDGRLDRIYKKSRDGSDLFIAPMFVTQNINDDIIVSDHGSFVKILSKEGDIRFTYISNNPGSEFWGVTTDRDGNILVADLKYGIHILDCNGNFKQLRSDFSSYVQPLSIDRHSEYNSFMIGTSSGEIFYMN